MTDPVNSGNDNHRQDKPPALPHFVAGGRVSLAALRERIEEQFAAETESRQDILLDATDEPARRDLIRETMDYVLAVEGILLSRPERLLLLDVLYSDLFRFGPLDTYLTDPTITELMIDGPDRVFVRYGTGEPSAVPDHFEDVPHLERIVRRALSTAGATLTESEPLVEAGMVMLGRPVRLIVAMPPVSPVMHVEIRLHPPQAVTLAQQVTSGLMDESAARLLQAILAAGHGLMIVGDAGSGKTMLLESLLPCLPEGRNGIIGVERSVELRLPAGMRRMVALPPATFADQISAALEAHPAWLVLDEVRFDEAAAMWQALTINPAPHDIWVFRGATDSLRLRTAFSMAVRRAQQGIEQALIYRALLDRLPFVALLARRDRQVKLIGIGEWQPETENVDVDTVTLRMLWPAAEAQPMHRIDGSQRG